MTNPNFKDAYLNPWNDPRDAGFLNAIGGILDQWFRARNGQREQIEVMCQWGIDKPTGRSMNLIIRVQVISK